MSTTATSTDLWISAVRADQHDLRKNEEAQLAAQGSGNGYLPIICYAPLTPEQEKELPVWSNLQEEYESHEKTLVNGLRSAASLMNSGGDGVPAIRANLGTGTSTTMFGTEQTVFPDKMPWVTRHVPLETLDNFDADTAPFGSTVELGLERSKYLAETLSGSGITPYCWDTQGPFDLAHLVLGDEIFCALYDEKERVHRLLDQCTRAIIRHTKAYKDAVGEKLFPCRHGNLMLRGGIRCCEDTSTLLNEEQIREFVVPYTNRALAAFGGGFVHYCGKNQFLYRAVIEEMPDCHVFNFGNPERHDMRKVLGDAIRQRKAYAGGIPRLTDEGVEAYFRRILGYTEGAGRGLILMPEIRPGEDVRKAVELWRRIQKLT